MMSKLIEKIQSNIDEQFITFYDFILNFSQYNNDSIRNTAIYLLSIGFDTFFEKKDYSSIHLYTMNDDYVMYASTFIRDTNNPVPKILKDLKNENIDKDNLIKIYLKRYELNNLFILRGMLDFIYQEPKPPTESKVGTPSVTIVQPSIKTLNERIKDKDNQITALNARIAELEKQLSEKQTEPNTPTTATLEMQAINEVYHQFWANYDSDKIPPKKDTIVNWIRQKYGLSKRIAEAIDSIARPEQCRQGGQKAR